LLVVVALLTWTPLLPAAPIPKPTAEQVRKELDALWADLLSADELTAGRALLKLATLPDDTVAYLKEKLRPLNLSKDRALYLIAELTSDNDAAVEAAFEELAYFDPRLALGKDDLDDALQDRPASRRLGAVLCDLPLDALSVGKWHWNSPDEKVYRFTDGKTIENRDIAIAVAGIGTQGRKATWARAVRVVALLEQIGSPGAVTILEALATGHPDAAPTKAAKVALARLKKK
jgi:hypothetical protein